LVVLVLVLVLVVVVDFVVSIFVVSAMGAGAAIVVESIGAMPGVVVVVVVVVDEAPTSPAAVPPAAVSSFLLHAPTATIVARAVIAEIALMRMCLSFLQ
jgi:hypothetical protein